MALLRYGGICLAFILAASASHCFLLRVQIEWCSAYKVCFSAQVAWFRYIDIFVALVIVSIFAASFTVSHFFLFGAQISVDWWSANNVCFDEVAWLQNSGIFFALAFLSILAAFISTSHVFLLVQIFVDFLIGARWW